MGPTLRNITENPTTVQFNHRILGTSTLAALLLTAARAQSLPLPPHLRLTALALGGMGCLQVAMGITTLLLYVPVPVAGSRNEVSQDCEAHPQVISIRHQEQLNSTVGKYQRHSVLLLKGTSICVNEEP